MNRAQNIQDIKARLLAYVSVRSLAKDDAKWITIHPNGKGVNSKGADIKGRACLIDSETGVILKGPPTTQGKPLNTAFNDLKQQNKASKANAANKAGAANVAKATKATASGAKGAANATKETQAAAAHAAAIAAKDKEIEALKQQLAQLQNAPQKVEHKKAIDTTLPSKIASDVVLQNRSRDNMASVQQMEDISRNLDYFKVGTSNDFNSGCPVVSFGSYDDKAMGKKTVLSTPNGKRLNVQYAVVEADDVTTSNKINGDPNENYNSDDPSFKRAIAGNGRMTGITDSYRANKDQAARYKNDLIENAADHGCDPDLIRSMNKPVLVRVMSPSDVTKDIGDQTNITQGLTLNAVEQARNDVNRLKKMISSQVQTYEDGSPTIESVKAFIRSLPKNEQSGLLTKDGQPTRTAQDRMQNAMMMNGYNDDFLVRLRGQAINPDGKNIINALASASGSFAGLEGGGDLDIRKDLNLVLNGFLQKTLASNSNGGAWQDDLLADKETNELARSIGGIIAENKRSGQRLTTIFKTIGENLVAAKEANDFLKHNGTLGGFESGILQSYETDRKKPLEVVKQSVQQCREEFAAKEQAKHKKANQQGGLFDLSEADANNTGLGLSFEDPNEKHKGGGLGLGFGLDSLSNIQDAREKLQAMTRRTVVRAIRTIGANGLVTVLKQLSARGYTV